MVEFDQITVDPGWNARERTPELEEHIDGITASLLNGGTVPPLSIYVNDEGKVVIVDGHCRREAIERARARGLEYNDVLVTEFKGNDADRIAMMFTSSQGKPLTPFEQAVAFKRLQALNWTTAQIAARTGKSLAHVAGLLQLANANEDVLELVKSQQVSIEAAVKTVKKSGGKAGQVLKDKVDDANKDTLPGQKRVKVTSQHVDEDFISRPIQRVMVAFFAGLEQEFGEEVHAAIKEVPEDQVVYVPARALKKLIAIQEAIKG